MLRVNLRQGHTNEVLDFFEVASEDDLAPVLAAKLTSGLWTLASGDHITIEEVS